MAQSDGDNTDGNNVPHSMFFEGIYVSIPPMQKCVRTSPSLPYRDDKRTDYMPVLSRVRWGGQQQRGRVFYLNIHLLCVRAGVLCLTVSAVSIGEGMGGWVVLVSVVRIRTTIYTMCANFSAASATSAVTTLLHPPPPTVTFG